MMHKQIYLDYAATTYVREEVIDAMVPYMKEIYGNPSSIHSFGQKAKQAMADAREQIADVLRAKPKEIYFTSGGTESDNWAIRGLASANAKKGKHIITSSIEHPAIMNACKQLAKQGYSVTYLDVDEFGTVDLKQLEGALTDETILVSIMYANNEIGTIEPIKEIGRIVKENSPAVFHVDAVQAVAAVNIDLSELSDVDAMSFSAHKFYGPKGVGGLFVRMGTRIDPLLFGGSQERKKRATTENVTGIVGAAKALTLAAAEREQEQKRVIELRDHLIKRVLGEFDNVRLNGHPTQRLPNNANFSFDFIEGEGLLLRMDQKGVAASTGSACSTASLEPSHVLLAIGLPHETAHGSYRITIGADTTKEDIDYTVDSLQAVVTTLRNLSPLYNPNKKG
ncbi:MAG: cysteine desulfurase NifS [Clostridia bacterium]|nr:cysteine desulfurase NifS [Clostridia bacterium]MBT7122247.1 cysteine desulfurase NifS [Clostridia bacterium]